MDGYLAVLACSPRTGGNSDAAARLFAQGAEQAGAEVRRAALRDYRVLPCTGCGACAVPPHACALARDDAAEELFGLCLEASAVCIAAPIFFYHLPAPLKAWIDRGQSLYQRREAGAPALAGLPRRPAYACLVAGRPRGAQLFSGSLLTLKYFFAPMNLDLAEPLAFRGIDAPGDLEADPAACAALLAAGRAAGDLVARPERELI
ncbi:MAG: flavodoxin family protein [Thermodesulfobacteriota bacterium]